MCLKKCTVATATTTLKSKYFLSYCLGARGDTENNPDLTESHLHWRLPVVRTINQLVLTMPGEAAGGKGRWGFNLQHKEINYLPSSYLPVFKVERRSSPVRETLGSKARKNPAR